MGKSSGLVAGQGLMPLNMEVFKGQGNDTEVLRLI